MLKFNLDVSSFDTNNVTNMSFMFEGCTGLTSLDVSKFDTSNVTNMSSMFNGCAGLKGVAWGWGWGPRHPHWKWHWNHHKGPFPHLRWMGGMFMGCSMLTEIDLSFVSFETVEVMSQVFSGCSALAEVELPSAENATVGKVETMEGMFENCTSLGKKGKFEFTFKRFFEFIKLFSPIIVPSISLAINLIIIKLL